MAEDKEIIRRLKTGDQAALKQLFDLYYRAITMRLYRLVPDLHLAEDIAQEVFINLWKKRDRLEIHSSLINFLNVSARNRLFNHLRSNKAKYVEIQEFHFDLKEEDAQRALESSEFQQQVFAAIEQLPPKARIIFGMSRFEQMSYKEIAERLDIPLKAVEYQMSKALLLLKSSILNKNKA